ncbi:unnamed protein product [Triticum turgidum subsp. durum]|uniref:RING-type domain-containing protein n=1 Tax=Triticum turgidum subsp. durum TaxID=4567 RepID=A0A9R0VXH7_TRITD|nr:unnamed protein product [Triticum turgidum subsp. durum]
MNHPAGDCPLCLYPLVSENNHDSALPFMKLMSCYHCFHSDCIMRWWGWLQHDDANSKKIDATVSTGGALVLWCCSDSFARGAYAHIQAPSLRRLTCAIA